MSFEEWDQDICLANIHERRALYEEGVKKDKQIAELREFANAYLEHQRPGEGKYERKLRMFRMAVRVLNKAAIPQEASDGD